MNNNIESIIHERGRPSLFISAIANSNWNQISNELMNNQSFNDRPDVVGQCFQKKLKDLILNLRNGTYFNGNTVEYLFYSVTWKKGKLPIVNILAKLFNEAVISVSNNFQPIIDWDGYMKLHLITDSIDVSKHIEFISKAEIEPILKVYVD
jgi:hypothetical protein